MADRDPEDDGSAVTARGRSETVAVGLPSRAGRTERVNVNGGSMAPPTGAAEGGSPVAGPVFDDRVSVIQRVYTAEDETGVSTLSDGAATSDFGLRYEVLATIGAGGMGQVFRVFDRDLGREVAAKTILPGRTDQDFVNRFIQEAQATSQLQHPNIIPIYDFGMTAAGHLYFTMKHVNGATLRQVIDGLRTGDNQLHMLYSWVRRLQVIQLACDALAFAHERGVLHRDLKPENMMIGSLGEVLVMDWGLAKLAVDQPSAGTSSSRAGSTGPVSRARKPVSQDGIILGTPAYMPPELVRGEGYDAQSEVYAIGAVMYELFTLLPPHSGTTALEILDSVRDKEPPEPEVISSDAQRRVPREISLIIVKALSKDRTDRYASTMELRADIQRYLEGMAQVVCVQTALKRSLSIFGTFVDNHGKLAIVIATAAVTVPTVTILAILLSYW